MARPQDLRPEPAVIGEVRNGYGMITARVRSDDDVALWVADSLVAALEEAGIGVDRVESIDLTKGPFAFFVSVLAVSGDARIDWSKVKIVGDVDAAVEVYRNGRPISKKTYQGHAERSGRFLLESGKNYKEVLHEALEDFLGKAAPDILLAISEAPQGVSPR